MMLGKEQRSYSSIGMLTRIFEESLTLSIMGQIIKLPANLFCDLVILFRQCLS